MAGTCEEAILALFFAPLLLPLLAGGFGLGFCFGGLVLLAGFRAFAFDGAASVRHHRAVVFLRRPVNPGADGRQVRRSYSCDDFRHGATSASCLRIWTWFLLWPACRAGRTSSDCLRPSGLR